MLSLLGAASKFWILFFNIHSTFSIYFLIIYTNQKSISNRAESFSQDLYFRQLRFEDVAVISPENRMGSKKISQTVCEILIPQLFLKSHPIFRGDNNNILVTIPISVDLQHINQQIFSDRLCNLHLRAVKSAMSITVVDSHPQVQASKLQA